MDLKQLLGLKASNPSGKAVTRPDMCVSSLQCWFCVYLLQQQSTELLPAVVQTESVCAVHHPHQPVCALEVVPPVGAQRLLTAYIPNVQLKPTNTQETSLKAKKWIKKHKYSWSGVIHVSESHGILNWFEKMLFIVILHIALTVQATNIQ